MCFSGQPAFTEPKWNPVRCDLAIRSVAEKAGTDGFLPVPLRFGWQLLRPIVAKDGPCTPRRRFRYFAGPIIWPTLNALENRRAGAAREPANMGYNTPVKQIALLRSLQVDLLEIVAAE